MIVTREDVTTGETEIAEFESEGALYAWVAYLMVDSVVRMKRKPIYDFEKALKLIREERCYDAWCCVYGSEIAADLYIHVNTEVTIFLRKDVLNALRDVLNEIPEEVIAYGGIHVCAPIDLVRFLRRGDIVKAVRDLPAANVLQGAVGIVFEEAEFHEPGTGPMVRWMTGTACNVYDADIEKDSVK